MFTANFKKTFAIRFFGYLGILAGVITLLLGVEPVIGEELRYRSDRVFGVKHVVPNIISSAGAVDQPSEEADPGSGRFGAILSGTPNTITPVSTDFGIVIEKINANAKVIEDVDPASETAYMAALAEGVAHAKGTNYPGQVGNVYLFSHSVDAPWNVVRYNAIFYLLSKLESGDRVIIYYQGRRYDYFVFDKVIVPPTDTKYLTLQTNESLLTLQTCDPPGTTLNRLIVRAKLIGS